MNFQTAAKFVLRNAAVIRKDYLGMEMETATLQGPPPVFARVC